MCRRYADVVRDVTPKKGSLVWKIFRNDLIFSDLEMGEYFTYTHFHIYIYITCVCDDLHLYPLGAGGMPTC